MEPGRKPLDLLLDGIGDRDGLEEILKGLPAFVRQSLLSSAQEDFRLHLVALAQEFLRLGAFEFEVVGVGTQTDADTLRLHLLLFRLGLLYLLCLLILELSVIQDTADGRFGLRRDFHEVQLLLLRQGERLGDGYLAMVFAIGVDETYDRNTNLLVDAEAGNDFYFWPRSAEFSPSDMVGLNDLVELMGIAPMSSDVFLQWSTSLVRFA